MNEDNKNKDYEFVLLERLEGKVDTIIEGQRLMESEQKEIKEKVGLLAEDMDYVKSEIVEIKDRFKETDNKLAKRAGQETINDHETRITKLEKATLAEA